MDAFDCNKPRRLGGPAIAAFRTGQPEEMAYALRQWQAHIGQAAWGLDSALRALRIANEAGEGQDIADARNAVCEAQKRAQEVWELLT